MARSKIEKLTNLLNSINRREQDLFDFSVEQEGKDIYIVDSCEEFYYGGFAFDRIYTELEEAIQTLFGEDHYLDCCCPGRWIIG